jgi:two-component system, NarL family, response regulator NreC
MRGAVSVVGTSELFSPREREILKLLGQGKTSKEIAVLLTLRKTTIASHRRSICHKLGIHSTAGLIQYAVVRLASRSGIEIQAQ